MSFTQIVLGLVLSKQKPLTRDRSARRVKHTHKTIKCTIIHIVIVGKDTIQFQVTHTFSLSKYAKAMVNHLNRENTATFGLNLTGFLVVRQFLSQAEFQFVVRPCCAVNVGL